MIFISQNIKYLVDKSELSQDAFGAQFGITKNLTGQYIAGKSKPKLEVLTEIARHYDLTLDELVNENLANRDLKDFSDVVVKLFSGQTTLDEFNKDVILKRSSKRKLIEYIEKQQERIGQLEKQVQALKIRREEFDDVKNTLEATHLRSSKAHDNQAGFDRMLNELLDEHAQMSKELHEIKDLITKQNGK